MKAKEYLSLFYPSLVSLPACLFYDFVWLIHLYALFLQAVPKSKGQALADEYGIKFFETVRCGYRFCYT